MATVRQIAEQAAAALADSIVMIQAEREFLSRMSVHLGEGREDDAKAKHYAAMAEPGAKRVQELERELAAAQRIALEEKTKDDAAEAEAVALAAKEGKES